MDTILILRSKERQAALSPERQSRQGQSQQKRFFAASNQRFSRGLRELCSHRGLSGLITVLEDKQYMVTVREKMNNIKKVAKFYNYDFLNAGK